MDVALDEAENVCCASLKARPKARLSSPIRPMLVAAQNTPNGADHEKKHDPRTDEITETQTPEVDSHARSKKQTYGWQGTPALNLLLACKTNP